MLYANSHAPSIQTPLPQVFPRTLFQVYPALRGDLKLIHQVVYDCLPRRVAFITFCE
jgi:hypothetical protein